MSAPKPHFLYLDTSALLRVYLEHDPLTAYVLEQIEACEGVVVSELAFTEAVSALARRKHRKAMTGPHFTRAKGRFLQDWPSYQHYPVRASTLGRAAQLCEKHASLRTLDAIHLATVLELSEAGEMRFLTFDVRQRDVARLELGNRVLEDLYNGG